MIRAARPEVLALRIAEAVTTHFLGGTIGLSDRISGSSESAFMSAGSSLPSGESRQLRGTCGASPARSLSTCSWNRRFELSLSMTASRRVVPVGPGFRGW